MSQELVDAFTNMREEEALRISSELLESGADPMGVLDACKEAMAVIGQRFGTGEYFLPELLMAGEMMQQIADIVKPKMRGSHETKRIGKVVMGTVQGDIHNIGKDIVIFMLDVNGFEVMDLGVDVPVETFVEKIREVQPDVVGLSGLLTLSFESMKKTVEAIDAVGLRSKVKIMIGGATIDENVLKYSGADALGPDAMAAVSLAKEWVRAKLDA